MVEKNLWKVNLKDKEELYLKILKLKSTKKIELVMLERLTPERAKEVLLGPHHCTYPGVVMSETSTSTEIRQINDTNTNLLGSAKTYPIENTCSYNPIALMSKPISV